MHFSLPTVTMVVMGYNQEASIGYAIDSALAQDYAGPITFVLSDDCSQDATFRVMQEKAAAYRGPHRVLLNRNEKNLKYAGHLIKALSLAPSELQCKQDGDDYSAPDRVRLQVEAFLVHPDATFVLGDVKKVEVDSLASPPDFAAMEYRGNGEIRAIDPTDVSIVTLGGVGMWKRECLERLAPVFASYGGTGEDGLLGIVSRLYGDLLGIDREIICYVFHEGNSSYVSRNARYSSLKAFQKSERHLQDMVGKRLPWNRWVVDWARRYMDEHDDITLKRRSDVSLYLDRFSAKNRQQEIQYAYLQRALPAKLWHWLLHRDAPLSCLCPSIVKGVVGCALHRLRRTEKI